MIYFLSFYTEGPDVDGCLNLSDNAQEVKKRLSKYFDDMFLFTKTTLKKLPGTENICNVFEEETQFVNGNKLGYFDFKPFLIGYTLSKIPENSLLIYHDLNFNKYPSYWNTDWDNIRSISEKLLKDNDSDFWVKFELHNCFVKNFVKTYTIDYFFENPVENRIVKNSHLFNAGQIIMRNTKFTRDFISDWIKFCENKELLKSSPNPNPDPESKMIGCQEQDVMNCLIYRLILDGKLRPEFPIYSFNWRTIRMDNYYLLKNEQIINYLNHSEYIK